MGKPGNLQAANLDSMHFEVGELYLFHKTDPKCPDTESLWGIFDKREGKQIYLEAAAHYNSFLSTYTPLPDGYRYVRLSTRDELRDFMYMLAVHDLDPKEQRKVY